MPSQLHIEELRRQIAFVHTQLNSLERDEFGTTRLMWENRLADLEAQLEDFDGHYGSEASVALVFQGSPVIGQKEIRLDFASQALDHFQKIVAISLAAQQIENVEQKGPVPRTGSSRLYIRDMVRGSVGFILEELVPEQVQLFPTPLKVAVESSTALITSLMSDDNAIFEKALEAAQGRQIEAIQKFARLLRDEDATARILDDKAAVELTRNSVAMLAGRLAEVRVDEEVVMHRGILLGILPESHQFEFRLSTEDRTLKGSTTDEFAERYRSSRSVRDLVLQMVEAEMRIVSTIRRGEVVKTHYILEEASLFTGKKESLIE